MAKYKVGQYVFAQKHFSSSAPETLGIITAIVDAEHPQYIVRSIDGESEGLSFFYDERLLSN